MADVHVEIERKYDVGETFVLPGLAGVPGVTSVDEPVEHVLEAAYYDTADLRLGRARVTLRRRTGGTDAGWHVKLPGVAGARRELHSPLGRAARTPPKAVLAPVVGIVRSAAPTQVALLRTRRIVTELRDVDGRVLAEVANDHVTGTAFPAEPGEAAVVTSWREVEVELVSGDDDLLAAVGAALVAAGAEPSRSPSKLTRVLGNRLAVAAPADPPAAAAVSGQPEKKGGGKKARRRRKEALAALTAGDVLRAALVAQTRSLQDADVMVRSDQPDGVHQLRVACRRLRSVLAAFRPVLDRESVEPVRAELQWIGAQLAGSRDAEVAVAHLRELVAGQPPELVLGPVAARMQQEDLRDGLAGGDAARRTLASPRYLSALDTLAELAADPPLTERATEPAVPVVAEVLTHTGRRLRHLVEAADDADDPAALHDVRKAAKRLRYNAEVAEPVLGAPVTGLITTLKEAQQVLGDRQDTFLTREVCTRLGSQAFTAGENAWTYGRLHALEEARCAQAEREFWLRWPAVRQALPLRPA
ncbi:CHAD domain-containing protein [Modestobacter sp. DSM 44400]|uniref:CYTH and CHAD domain-containing protein n=1 Tax=Modestobacter sp. DSM 44400 TaxID=1550230 RepID=UPI0008984A4E|nr:CYTH and CHAD domain-containing protein [Modestobacter sp. DSM 44400]SDY17824.1 CHAD domain-containing protein [Modestobacter sp. DSM 44400]